MSALQLDGLVGADRDSCIIWRLDAAFANEIGRTALSAVLLNAYAWTVLA